MAAKNKIKIYTIGVGTNGTAPFPLTDLNGNKVYQYVPVELDEKMLRAIAAKTGGAYFRAQNSKALGAVYSEIDKLEKSRTSIQHDVAYFAKYRLFLFIALFFLFTEQVLKYTYFRTFAR